jgi:signal transduction histidine kinase/ActR/RegA family two-component response regulator
MVHAPFPLEAILATSVLAERPPRPADPAAESRVYARLAAALVATPARGLDEVARALHELAGGGPTHSTGISVLERTRSGPRFRWAALAGALADRRGLITPHESPSGACLDLGKPQLYQAPARRFTYLGGLAVSEVLVAPLGGGAGTIWIATHEGAELDATDLRLVGALAGFAGLALALERAASAMHSRDEFLTMLSHELRTPLNAILGWSQLLAAGQLDPARQARALESVTRNARAQARLIEDLLEASHLSAGPRLALQALPLRELVETQLAEARTAAEGRRLSLTLVVEAGPVVDGDPERLGQLVHALLSNALKFSRPGGRILLELGAAGGRARLTVSDDGIGISADFLPHLFEPFRQADGSPTRAHGGLGLGLSLARRIAELHGGTLSARSDGLGHGASFTLDLPLSSRPCAPPGERRRRAPHLNLAGLMVLLVEDEPDARELYALELGRRGAEVLEARTASEALRVLAAQRCHVIVSDIGLPDDDGYALMRAVRERGDSTPALALTAYASAAEATRALDAGFHAHVPKPITGDELVPVVFRLAGRRPRATPVPF